MSRKPQPKFGVQPKPKARVLKPGDKVNEIWGDGFMEGTVVRVATRVDGEPADRVLVDWPGLLDTRWHFSDGLEVVQ